MPEDSRGEKRTVEEEFQTIKKPHFIQESYTEDTEIKKECVEDEQSISNMQPINNDNSESTNTLKYFNGVEISKLSKRQLKKYHKTLKWLDIKKEKRAKERIKTKEKRLHAKLNNIDLGPSRKELKKVKMKNSPCKIGICIDLSFDELMIDKDMAKTIKQILRVYTLNRRSKAPMQLHLTSFNGRNKEEMSRHHGYENWDINFHSNDYLKIFPKEKLVYLTSESDNVMTELEDEKIYIIGGLVDHNSHKGLCYNKAVKEGIAHAQLPIGEYFWMKHRKVLTINQVFEILLGVSEGKSFKEAFELILPKRIEKVSTDKPITIEAKDEDEKM
ncbi:tRNA methyltransferase 10 homolog A [Anoplophora glabripennis]|nr:tRNA methyltransferase 10 homolog A [Anoplophora glabripennis]